MFVIAILLLGYSTGDWELAKSVMQDVLAKIEMLATDIFTSLSA